MVSMARVTMSLSIQALMGNLGPVSGRLSVLCAFFRLSTMAFLMTPWQVLLLNSSDFLLEISEMGNSASLGIHLSQFLALVWSKSSSKVFAGNSAIFR